MDPQWLLADLDDDQRRAVTTPSQLVAVIAGAGSGKTRVLTRRLAYRVATGAAEEAHSLVATFTRQAAGELRRRMPQLGLRGSATVGTFHAIARGMLVQRWQDRDERPRQIDADRRARVARLAERADAEAVCDEIDWAAARGVGPDGYRRAVSASGRRPVADSELVIRTYERYRADQRRRGSIDLDDLLGLTIAELERDPSYAEAVRWRFRHLLVDEAQDLNVLQRRLLDLLRAERDDLFLVGDPSQAIYGFNGSDPSLLLDVGERFGGIEVVRLPSNHRCTPQVVAAGLHVLNADRQPAELAATRDDGRLVTIRRHADEVGEADAAAAAIGRLDATLVAAGQVAVLARTNAQLTVVEKALTRRGIGVRRAPNARRAAIELVLGQLRQLRSSDDLRRWVNDALEPRESSPTGSDADASEAATAAEVVARAVLDFLRVEPRGDVTALRAWFDRADPFRLQQTGVELLTFHGAKGREWHTVHLVGCETSLVPHRTATTAAARAEETRLLYVAITRATDELVINWAERRGGYQRKLTPLLEGFDSSAPPIVAPPPDLVGAIARPDQTLTRLRAWRVDAARRAGVVPEAICTDAALAKIAECPPANADELDAVAGLGAITSRRLFPSIADALDTS